MGYFLLPSRAWELLLGACLNCLPGTWRRAPLSLQPSLGVLGLMLIIGSAFWLHEGLSFPGFLALPPCLGAALLIWTQGPGAPAESTFWLTRLLESRFAVGTGLLSYSLYLWHWPLLAYWEYVRGSFDPAVALGMRMVLMIAAVGIAYLSWRWVEKPFRKRREGAGHRPVFTVAACALSLLGFLGLAVYRDGMPQRWPQRALDFAQAADDMGGEERGQTDNFQAVISGHLPRFGSDLPSAPMQVLVWGDSHARCLFPAITALSREHGQACCIASYNSTYPLLDLTSAACSVFQDAAKSVGKGC